MAEEGLTDPDASQRDSYAGFWRRVAAYCVDIIPIVAVVVTIAHQVGEFDSVLANHFHDRRNFAEGVKFLIAQNIISEASFLVYILYASSWSLHDIKLQLENCYSA